MGDRVVLIPMDTREISEFAFDYYIKKIKMPNDRVILFHCSEFRPPLHMINDIITGSSNAVAKLVEDHNTKMKQFIELLEKKLKSAGCSGEVKLGSGSPSQEIITEANKTGADLIIMASAGASALRRTLIGSVSDQVIHESDTPVLIVKQSK